MSLPFHLGLRYNRHLLSLVKLGDQPRPVLGVAYPEDTDRRARIPIQWGQATQSPRRSEPATIDLPLPQRTQTILSYQVNPQVRAALDGEPGPLVGSRRDLEPGLKQRLHLGPDHPGLPAETRARLAAAAATGLSATPEPRNLHGRH